MWPNMRMTKRIKKWDLKMRTSFADHFGIQEKKLGTDNGVFSN